MLYTQFSKNIESGEIAPVYFITGEESYLHLQCQNALKTALIQPGAEDFDLEVLDGSEFRYDAFINSLRSLPIMSQRRLLLLKRFNEVDTRRYKNITEALEGDLSSVVVALSYDGKPDFRVKSIAELRDRYAWVNLAAPKGAEFQRILQSIVPERELDSGLVSFLADSEVDLYQISGWLRQADNMADAGEKLTLERMRDFIDLGGAADIWQFSDAVSGREMKRAQHALLDMLRNREKPGAIMWRLKSLFEDLNLALKIKSRGARPEKYIDKKIMHPFKLKKLLEHSGSYSVKEVESALLKLQETDARLKSAGGEDEALLIELVDEIIGGEKR